MYGLEYKKFALIPQRWLAGKKYTLIILLDKPSYASIQKKADEYKIPR